MVPESASEMETRKNQRIVHDRVFRRSKEQRCRGRRQLRDARPVEMSGWRGKDRRSYTGARQQVRGQEPSPAVGKMRLGFRSSSPRQRIQNQKSTTVHVNSVMRRRNQISFILYFCRQLL